MQWKSKLILMKKCQVLTLVDCFHMSTNCQFSRQFFAAKSLSFSFSQTRDRAPSSGARKRVAFEWNFCRRIRTETFPLRSVECLLFRIYSSGLKHRELFAGVPACPSSTYKTGRTIHREISSLTFFQSGGDSRSARLTRQRCHGNCGRSDTRYNR